MSAYGAAWQIFLPENREDWEIFKKLAREDKVVVTDDHPNKGMAAKEFGISAFFNLDKAIIKKMTSSYTVFLQLPRSIDIIIPNDVRYSRSYE